MPGATARPCYAPLRISRQSGFGVPRARATRHRPRISEARLRGPFLVDDFRQGGPSIRRSAFRSRIQGHHGAGWPELTAPHEETWTARPDTCRRWNTNCHSNVGSKGAFHRGIDATGVGSIPRTRSEPGGMELAGNHV